MTGLENVQKVGKLLVTYASRGILLRQASRLDASTRMPGLKLVRVLIALSLPLSELRKLAIFVEACGENGG